MKFLRFDKKFLRFEKSYLLKNRIFVSFVCYQIQRFSICKQRILFKILILCKNFAVWTKLDFYFLTFLYIFVA